MFRDTHKIYFFISFVYQELFPDILFYLRSSSTVFQLQGALYVCIPQQC